MKAGPLLLVTAVLEGTLGILLMLVPRVVVDLLLGAALDPPVAMVVARVAGAALLTLGVACWLLRKAEVGHAARALVTALTVYNVAVFAVLIHGAVGYDLTGIGLWPAVILHVALSLWCIACLFPTPSHQSPR